MSEPDLAELVPIDFDDRHGLTLNDLRFADIELDAGPEEVDSPRWELSAFRRDALAAVTARLQGVRLVLIRVTIGRSRLLRRPVVTNQGFVFDQARRVTPIRLVGRDLDARLLSLAEGKGTKIDVEVGSGHAGVSPVVADPDPLVEDLAGYLHAAAPDAYHVEERAPAKEAFIDEALAGRGSPVAVEPDPTRALLAELARERTIALGEPASEQELTELAAILGFDVPAELRLLLALADGAPGLFGFRDLMPAEAIGRVWAELKQIWDEWSLEDLQAFHHGDGAKTHAIYTTPYWIPFVEEHTGNYVAIDLLPATDGRVGQIIYYGVDEQTIRCLADDLNEFLSRELEHAQADADGDESWF